MLTEDQAALLLEQSDVVAIPTETVYGLAARIDRPEAIEKIFRIKERPSFDPLIVHVSSIEQAKLYANEWTEIHQKLASQFWPGPLTLVVSKNDKVSTVITSGLDSVGLRYPQHLLTLSLINKIGVPLAAPSANKFGKTSPTTAQHVKESLPEVEILDGGDCKVGIESTIVSIQNGSSVKVQLLRPGMIQWTQIKEALSGFQVEFIDSNKKIMAPGNLEDHYMPELPLVLVETQVAKSELKFKIKEIYKKEFNNFVELILSKEAVIAARELYAQLRKLSQSQSDAIYFQVEEYMKNEDWLPIMDRITKASTFKI
ncbi:MAG: threonylcarbamoyl-AMP synthase [Bdellovibrionales bacterium]|nr:threonylcarbamoyl-AMP synthase [Bdellovibrionales bacterium]